MKNNRYTTVKIEDIVFLDNDVNVLKHGIEEWEREILKDVEVEIPLIYCHHDDKFYSPGGRHRAYALFFTFNIREIPYVPLFEDGEPCAIEKTYGKESKKGVGIHDLVVQKIPENTFDE